MIQKVESVGSAFDSTVFYFAQYESDMVTKDWQGVSQIKDYFA